MTQAGAFGGGRQAILDAETQRSLGTNLANITGQGYNTAYGNAMSQFNADQQRKMQEAQFGSNQGMTNAQLKAQYGLAGQQAGEQSKQFGSGFGLGMAPGCLPGCFLNIRNNCCSGQNRAGHFDWNANNASIQGIAVGFRRIDFEIMGH
jgi:hypothetical protein